MDNKKQKRLCRLAANNIVVRYIYEQNGQPKDIPMDSLSEAYSYLDEHKNDDYYSLSIISGNKNQNVEKIFEKSLGEVREFSDEQEVKLRENFIENERERDYHYEVINIHEDSGICSIRCINSKSIFGSIELAELRMIEPV